jgi:PAS domain-containing protein
MAGAITDVTDRRLAAAELFAEKERAQVTLASIADGVITTDTEGRVQYLNPVAEALTGWATASAHRLPLRAIFRMIDETNVARHPVRSRWSCAGRNGDGGDSAAAEERRIQFRSQSAAPIRPQRRNYR